MPEFAGETFAMDPGTCDYANPLSFTLKTCQRHNMLVPTGPLTGRGRRVRCLLTSSRAARATKPHSTLSWMPRQMGGLLPEVDLTWDSPSPDMLTIADEYDLAAGDGVDFHWNTQQAVEITGSQIIVTGKKGTVVITAPSECSARVDDLPLMDGAVQRQIAIHKPGRSGRLEITVKLRSAP